MLPDSIKLLIINEQERQNNQFIKDNDMTTYLNKLGEKAEIVSDIIEGQCRGFIAFYCNDMDTKKAFISLLLVDPSSRGLGLGRALVAFVLNTAKSRGFLSCYLEVCKKNQAAYNLYVSQGFALVEDRREKYLLVCNL